VRFGRSDDDVATDVGVCPPHVDPPPDKIDVASPERGCLAPSQSRVSKKKYEHPVGTGCGRQVVDLFLSQEDVITALGTGELEAASRVGTNALATDSMIEYCRGHEYRLPDA